MLKTILFLLILVQTTIYGQVDTVQNIARPRKVFFKSLILPSSLVVVGGVVKETNFHEYFQKKVQNSKFRTDTKIDDFIQYAPIVELYAADIYFKKDKNKVFQHAKNLTIAELLTAIIVQSIKYSVNTQRPDGNDNSFFSGHTSQAFTGATALYLEYKETNKFYALSGYGFSTATGILRVTNNRHWLSDVIVGAGIGIFSARLVWYINPLPNWQPFKSKKVAVYPYVNSLEGNAGLRVVF